MTRDIPAIRDEEHLEELLSEPTPGVVEMFGRLPGDLVILGVGGKMGPSLARRARRATDSAGVPRRIVGVARFTNPSLPHYLQTHGIETVVCDLLDPDQVKRLPDAPLVMVMAGMKFGATGQEALTWAMNTHVPSVICAKYRQSRIVAFSTGNVYALTRVQGGGSREADALRPVGEYSMSCVGRERIYEHFSRTAKIPTALLRLNYATEMRYGVLVDIALHVLRGETVDVTMGHVNTIWQGDANAMALCAFEHVAVPPRILNLAGPELLSVRLVADEFGRLLGKTVKFVGQEEDDAYLSDARESYRLFGQPRVLALQMIRWIADWVQRGGANLGKPTHFEVRDGKF